MTLKEITLEEIKQHNSRKSVWFVIENHVYDVTNFLDEHPGGEEVLLEQGGKDATEIFEDVNHSSEAKDLMKQYLVGKVPEHEQQVKAVKKTRLSAEEMKVFDNSETATSISWTQWAMTVAISTSVGLLVRYWINSNN